MADSREMTYGIGFDADKALGDIEKVEKGIEGIDRAEQQAQVGAQNVSQALSGMGASGAGAANEAGAAAVRMGADFRDAGDDASDRFRKMGADAESFGAAFRKTTSAAIKDGQSLAQSFQKGMSGALAFTGKKFDGFRNNVSKGAKTIGNAFIHPIQTIKSKLAAAFDAAEKSEKGVEDQSEKTEKALNDMGAAGEKGGNQIRDAMMGAFKAFLGIEAIKAGVNALKDFIGSALDAAKATENTAAKFDRLFAGTDAQDWANSYADAVHRSTTEVKGFLVQNQAMFSELGITGEAATELSEITTSLAYDFGNAFKMEDAEALSVLQDAIKGNTSALAEYGFNLDDATLKEEALKLGLSGNIDQLDDATKAQLRMNAILDQSADIQRAAIEQTGGLVNSTKSLKGIWANFMEDAGAKFTPAIEKFFGVIMDAWPRIEPMLMGLVEMLSDGLSQAMPIMTELGMTLLPILVDVLGTVFKAVTPLLQVFNSLAQAILPPLAEILKVLVDTLLPPILSIFDALVPIIQTLMPVIKQIAEAILPPIAQLLGLVAPILDAISPVLEIIGNALGVIADILGKTIGWLADGVGKVVGFFSNLFGGAKESKKEVEGLSGAVNGLGEATSKETTLAVDTSSYTKDISTASAQANTAAQENIIATKDISDLNLQLMGAEATSTYSTMAINAEEAWTRMTNAAEMGAKKIVEAFRSIASAAQGVSNANISVSGAGIPGHASGTDDFEGGWTRINERGGEVAFLPSGSAIIPADKSDRLIAGATTNSTSSTTATYAPPQIQITIQGNADSAVIDEMMAKLKTTFKSLYEEARQDELTTMSLKNAYA